MEFFCVYCKTRKKFDKFVKAQYNSSNGQPPKDIEEKIKKFKLLDM